jgi:DNA polymerase/3'-5' exonuclease PolX
MDPRRVTHVLSRISSLLEPAGVDRFRARAYRGAAEAIRGVETDDITGMYRCGELATSPVLARQCGPRRQGSGARRRG